MTFRAVATAELPLPELRRALMRFIDDIESRPYPEPEISVDTSKGRSCISPFIAPHASTTLVDMIFERPDLGFERQ